MRKSPIQIKLVKGNSTIVAYRIKSLVGAISVFSAGGKEYRVGDSVLELDAKDLAAQRDYKVTVVL